MSAGYGNNRRGGQNSYNRKKTEKSKIVDKKSYDDFIVHLPFIQNLKNVGPMADVGYSLSNNLYKHFNSFDLRYYMSPNDWEDRDIMKYYDCMNDTKSAFLHQIDLYLQKKNFNLDALLMACGSWLMGSFIIGVKSDHKIMEENKFTHYFYVPSGSYPMDFFNSNGLRTRLTRGQRYQPSVKDRAIHQEHLNYMVSLFGFVQGLTRKNKKELAEDRILNMLYQYLIRYSETLQEKIKLYEDQHGKSRSQTHTADTHQSKSHNDADEVHPTQQTNTTDTHQSNTEPDDQTHRLQAWNRKPDSDPPKQGDDKPNSNPPKQGDNSNKPSEGPSWADEMEDWEKLEDGTGNSVPAKNAWNKHRNHHEKKDSDTPKQGDDSGTPEQYKPNWESNTQNSTPENSARPNAWHRPPNIVPHEPGTHGADTHQPEPRTHGAGTHQPDPPRTRTARIKIPKIYVHKTFNPAYEYVPDNEATLRDWKGTVLEKYDTRLPLPRKSDQGVDWERIQSDQLIIMLQRMIAMYCHNRKKEKYRSYTTQKKIENLTRTWEHVKLDLKSKRRTQLVRDAVKHAYEHRKDPISAES